jgi:hypothetical protein
MKRAFTAVALTLFVVALAGSVAAQTTEPATGKLTVIYVSATN